MESLRIVNNKVSWNSWWDWKNRSHAYFDELLSEFLLCSLDHTRLKRNSISRMKASKIVIGISAGRGARLGLKH